MSTKGQPMGVLTDLVLADESEAEAICKSMGPLQSWPGIDAKGIDHIKLGMLLSILTGEPYRDSFIDECVLLAEEPEDGPWVYRVPEQLVGLLADLDGDRLTQTATAWSKIEEFVLDGWSPPEVGSVLAELHRIAREARAQGKSLLMWVCL